jgi:hypothetical protein
LRWLHTKLDMVAPESVDDTATPEPGPSHAVTPTPTDVAADSEDDQ